MNVNEPVSPKIILLILVNHFNLMFLYDYFFYENAKSEHKKNCQKNQYSHGVTHL